MIALAISLVALAVALAAFFWRRPAVLRIEPPEERPGYEWVGYFFADDCGINPMDLANCEIGTCFFVRSMDDVQPIYRPVTPCEVPPTPPSSA